MGENAVNAVGPLLGLALPGFLDGFAAKILDVAVPHIHNGRFPVGT